MAAENCYGSALRTARPAAHCFVMAGLVLAICLNTPARQSLADDSKEVTYGDQQQTFRWFGTLGYPDVAKAKLVMVTKGQRVPNGATAPHTSCELGFLLSEEGNRFTVLSLTLQTMQYTKAPEPPKGEHHQLAGDGAWFEPIDLVKVATAMLNESRSADQLPEINQVARLFFRSPIPESLRLFILAWACSRQGQEQLAKSLFERAKQIPEHGPAERRPKRQLGDRISEELAKIEMWEAMIAFSDPNVSRQALLDHLIAIRKRFPECPYIDRARETANLLTLMIVEDRNHTTVKPGDPAWEKLEAKEQIAELIFQLRDQNSDQMFTDGPISISFGSRKHQTPADLLAAFGPQAVPQLLDALSDPRPSRSVGAVRTYFFSHHVLTVGECACEILERIANRSFYMRKSTSGYMSSDGQTQAVEAAARQWYADFVAKGEKQTLVDATVAGDRNSPPQATVLVKKYPDAALPALIAGARAAKERHVRAGLVHLIGELPGEEPQAFVLAELKASPFVSGRLHAAEILHRQGRPEAVPAMIERWKHPDLMIAVAFDSGPSDDLPGVASFLAGCGRPEAIQALAESYWRQNANMRATIVTAFCYRYAAAHDAEGAGNSDDELKQPAARASDGSALLAATVELLMIAIDDTEAWQGAIWLTQQALSKPRICDLAGYALGCLDPERFSFNPYASLPERDRARLVLKNVWLKEQGKPELPLPKTDSAEDDARKYREGLEPFR